MSSTAVAKAKQHPNGLPKLPEIPAYSPKLQKLVEQLEGKFTDYKYQIRRNKSGDYKYYGAFYLRDPADLEGLEEVKAEARTVFNLCKPAFYPATPSVILNWLRPIAAGVRNPPVDEVDFAAKASAIAMACEELPVYVFTANTQKQALRKFKFWPSAADVYELLEEEETEDNDCWRDVRENLLNVLSIRGLASDLEKELAEAERLKREEDQRKWDEERAKRAEQERIWREKQQREQEEREAAEQKRLEAEIKQWHEEIQEAAEQYLREYKRKQREEQEKQTAGVTDDERPESENNYYSADDIS